MKSGFLLSRWFCPVSATEYRLFKVVENLRRVASELQIKKLGWTQSISPRATSMNSILVLLPPAIRA
jgi:hypothetical protein